MRVIGRIKSPQLFEVCPTDVAKEFCLATAPPLDGCKGVCRKLSGVRCRPELSLPKLTGSLAKMTNNVNLGGKHDIERM